MPQLGWAARPDGWIYYYNQQWFDYTGTTPEQMQGWGWQSVHNPDLLPLVMKSWTHSITTREPFEMAFQLRRHDGVLRWFLTRVRPMWDAGGTLVRWVGINTDIHEQKQAEEAAEKASRAKDEFLAMLGHELRNPLAPIVTALRLMEIKDADACRRERTIIERQTVHLSRLVDDLLDVSRFLRGKVDIRPEPIEVEPIVAQACEMVSPLLERKNHALDVRVPEGLTIDADAARLKQVVVNLLTNAAKYTPPGGRIAVTAEATAADVTIRIRDNGIGIPPELLPVLFQPFVQRGQSLERAEGGLGLGLTIAQSIVTAHNGSIDAHSAGDGHGSEFIVRLPRESSRASPRAQPPPPRPGSTRSRRILVVDDNADAAESLAEVLRQHGHVTHVEYDAPGALSAAEVFGPDVVLMDLGLPDMDGYELARRFRGHARLGHAQIIAVTGCGQASDRERTVAVGFRHHFVKPVDLDALLNAVEQLDDIGTA